jgi:hypothetical protein
MLRIPCFMQYAEESFVSAVIHSEIWKQNGEVECYNYGHVAEG